ncbi:MAG: tetratricopeptide repeat protein, partial [Deltaproteobacteria bacterium]|nr:tetratricopeptide repeat protein [Deltaproteobacteria bacterium]
MNSPDRRRLRRRLARLVLSASLGLGLGALALPASADRIDKLGNKLTKYQSEVRRVGDSVRPPTEVGKPKSSQAISRKVIEAQVQFGMANYDDASVILYDVVEGHKNHASYDEALYYLAESLFQKGDNLAARAYFKRLVKERGSRSKFFQQGLERLVELSLRLNDSAEVDTWLRMLDSLPQAGRRPSVPYVRGKYAHFRGDHDAAIKYFSQVPTTSKYSFQAQYFIGAAHISKKDLGAAARTYSGIIGRRAKTDKDRRVIELAHMALGRLFYERDQPSKAIDSYLNVGRKSDLFDDVLFEVAWVYVKNKEFPKALRALELLQLTDPKSSRLPEVRILEGNLRIRKAQKQYDDGTGNPAEEYDKAFKVFTATRKAYTEPRDALDKILAEEADPAQFIAQITGRDSKTFETSSVQLPEVAAAWLREEPDVQRVVQVESDLGSIQEYIDDANQTIRRLELAVSSDARVDVFPELAERRYRILDIRDDTETARSQLLTSLEKRTRKVVSASEQQQLSRFAADRKRLQGRIDALSGKKSATTRAKANKGRFTSVDKRGSELRVILESTEAEIVALERYIATTKEPIKNAAEIKKKLADEKAKVQLMRKELSSLREDAQVGRDAAGASADSVEEKRLRAELRRVLDAETRFTAGLVGKLGGKGQRKAQQILRLLQTANA